MKLLSCVGNLVEVVIPRPGPTGEEVPGVGKVCDLHLHLPFFLSECEILQSGKLDVQCMYMRALAWLGYLLRNSSSRGHSF